MKIVKVFALFVLIHLAGWGMAHAWMQKHQEKILVVVDTSYAMKPKFTAMEQWIEKFESASRYKDIVIGTDKAMLGTLDQLKSKTAIFRTAFGSMNADNLTRYESVNASEKILLSDGKLQAEGWKVIKF